MDDNTDIENIDIDALFKDENFENLDTQDTKQEPVAEEPKKDDLDLTKSMSDRINSVKKKTEEATQERIAKDLGYESYADLQKANEKKMLKDAGYDEEDIADIVNKIVEKRIADDPRMKRLEEIESQEKNNFVVSQLKEISKLSGLNYTSVDQLPEDTLKLWEKTGNLKQAYLATEGEKLLTGKAPKKVDSLAHLADTGMKGSSTKTRHLNESEKAIWRSVFPDITDDELNKKMTNI